MAADDTPISSEPPVENVDGELESDGDSEAVESNVEDPGVSTKQIAQPKVIKIGQEQSLILPDGDSEAVESNVEDNSMSSEPTAKNVDGELESDGDAEAAGFNVEDPGVSTKQIVPPEVIKIGQEQNLIQQPGGDSEAAGSNVENPGVSTICIVNTPVVIQTEQEQSLILRCGPRIREYVSEFLRYLGRQTGFRLRHFQDATELQRTARRMANVRLPLEIWRSFMNATTRWIAMSNIIIDSTTFIDTFIQIFCLVVQYYTESVFLRCVLWAIGTIGKPTITPIIIAVYHFLNFFAGKLTAYIGKKMKEFSEFAIQKIQSRSYPQLPHSD